MPTRFRIATFNVENLFSRPKLLNLDNHAEGDRKLRELVRFESELARKKYDPSRILQLYRPLKDYVDIVEVRGKLFDRAKRKVVAKGREEWEGWVELKRDRFSDVATANTAKVIQAIDAPICCLCEVESRPVLSTFAGQKLKDAHAYPYNRLLDGNDPRGIDVGILSRFPLTGIRTHIDDADDGSRVFSRDCLEVQVAVPQVGNVWILLNHLKSKGGPGTTAGKDGRRRRQAERVRDILGGRYDLTRDLLVVAGDFNDTPDSAALAPLLGVPNLNDVLAWKFPNAADR